MSFLYLLTGADGVAFKIGISADPASRGGRIGRNVSVSTSRQFEFAEGEARDAERLLHFLFRAHRHEVPKSDGYTEWFKIEAFSDVLAFLRGHRDRLGWITEAVFDPATAARGPQHNTPWQARLKALGISQKQLAALTGLAENTVSRQMREEWPMPRYVKALILALELIGKERLGEWFAALERDAD